MRVPNRLRTLMAVCALAATVAACSDGPTSAAPGAPDEGRILRPTEAAQVRPGDFIVIRPEEYTRYGITTTTGATRLGASMYREQIREEPCYLNAYGYDSCNPDPCYDQWGNYICYTDPCYDQWGNYICNPTPTPTPTTPQAQFNYGSSAPYDGWVNNGGILLKQLKLLSFSQSIANVASFSVSASFKNVGAADGAGCNNTAGAFDFASASGTGSGGYLEVSRVAQWLGTIKWQVDGTHSFTPISGATGGGTFYSHASFCG